MANKYAHYRGQRFSVVKEEGNYVTLEGYGYQKRHLKDEVIFEEEPEDKLLASLEDKLDAPKTDVEDFPKPVEESILDTKASDQHDVFGANDTEDDLVDPSPVNEPGQLSAKERELIAAAQDIVAKAKATKTQPTPIEMSLVVKAREIVARLKAEKEQLTAKEKADIAKAETHPIRNPKSGPVLAKEEVPAQVVPTPEFEQTPSPVGTKDYPNYPKIGIDTSIFSANDRHAENEKRRKDMVNNFKMKLKEMLQELDNCTEIEGVEDAHNMAEGQEGMDMSYETFEQFLQDFLAFAKDNDFVTPENEVDVDQAIVRFTGDKYADEFIKKLGGVNKTANIMKKKLAQMGVKIAEPAMAEDVQKMEEDGAAPPSAGGGAPSGPGGAVEVASTTGPGTTTANVANFNKPIGIGLNRREREKEKVKNLKEEQK